MNLEELKAKLAKIVSDLEALAGVESFTDEQVTEINALNEDFEKTKKQIEAKEKILAIQAASSKSTRKTAPEAVTPRVEVKATRKEKNGGFNNFGEMLVAVRNSASGNVDPRFKNEMFEKNAEDGGYLVPDEMLGEVLKKAEGDESLLARTTQFTVSGNNLSLPIDENQPFNGGVQAYWTAEGNPLTESKHSFGESSWKLNKLAALVKTTDELLEDAVALESYIRNVAPQAIYHKINEAILSGNGAGKPTGILNSSFRVQVAKESSQSSASVVYQNVIKMYSRMVPSSRARAVWYINPEVEEQLRTMKDDNNNLIYLAPGSQMNQNPYALLLGRPVIPLLGGMQAMGTEGDIVFADLGYYYSIVKSGGIKSAMSTHLLFDRDMTAYKFIFRVDGSCPFKAPIKVQNTTYELSGFVTLADRP